MQVQIDVVLVDIGNSQIKSAEVQNGAIQQIRIWPSAQHLFDHYDSTVEFMVCATGNLPFGFREDQVLTYNTKVPIEIEYKTPQTLGMDRVAAAVGASYLFPGKNLLLVDAGTCLTMDFIAAEGVFKGGVISPGLQMRMKSMSLSTANLPDISDSWSAEQVKLWGDSTYSCLLAGSYGGMLNEINGMLLQLQSHFTSINLIVTGGDAHHFESKLKAAIFAGSKMVLTGLYQIWKGLQG
ncbi:MAG: type III pantothenate kinase [Bacteroidota bacterium]